MNNGKKNFVVREERFEMSEVSEKLYMVLTLEVLEGDDFGQTIEHRMYLTSGAVEYSTRDLKAAFGFSGNYLRIRAGEETCVGKECSGTVYDDTYEVGGKQKTRQKIQNIGKPFIEGEDDDKINAALEKIMKNSPAIEQPEEDETVSQDDMEKDGLADGLAF